MEFSKLYQWEMETSDNQVLKQYEEDGKENTWTSLDPNKIVRVSFLPSLSILPRHDCLIDISSGERFIKRFRRNAHKHTTTNMDTLMSNCYKVTRDMCISDALKLFNDTQDSDLLSVFVVKHLRLDEKSNFFKQLIERWGAEATILTTIEKIGLNRDIHKWGTWLEFMGFPKNSVEEVFVECIVTNRYRMWVFSKGRVLITRNDYEVYI
jgi:hypothetical protein